MKIIMIIILNYLKIKKKYDKNKMITQNIPQINQVYKTKKNPK